MLSKQALEGIAAYKYKAGSYTIIDNLLNHYWNYVVHFLPIWMAPNLVTLIGTFIMIGSTIIQIAYSPHLSEPAPTWVYIQSGVCLFLYQTLDAIDGKQARRTGSSSPLGQLFDHGCDALCAIFNMVSAAASLQLGATLRSYIALSSVAISFYLAQWEEYHTGTMSCGNGYYGVTEGQLTLIALHFITAWQGNDFWKQSPLAPYINMSIVEALAVALVLSNIILAYTNITNVYNSSSSCSKKTSQQNSKEEIGHKTLSRSVAFLQLMPVFLNSVFGFVWITSKPNAQEYTQNPTFYLFVIGIGYVYFSTRMIVSHMAKVPFALQFHVIIPFGLLIVNSYLPMFGWTKVSPIRPLVASYLYGMYLLFVYGHYLYHVMDDICRYLNIYLLQITSYPQKRKE